MALPKTNEIITIKRLANTSWKKTYSTTVTTALSVYLYAPDNYNDFFATQDIESSLSRFRMLTEYADVQPNDEITDSTWKNYKVHKVDIKNSAWDRTTFYQCLLIESYANS